MNKKVFKNVYSFLIILFLFFTCFFIGVNTKNVKAEKYACMCKCYPEGDEKYDEDFISTVDTRVDKGTCTSRATFSLINTICANSDNDLDCTNFYKNYYGETCSLDCAEICEGDEDEDGNSNSYHGVCEATKKVYEFTYDAQGGFGCEYKDEEVRPEYIENEKVGKLCTPIKNGYAFDGWYTEDNVLVTEDSTFDKPVTLYAHWKLKPITCAQGTYLQPNATSTSKCSKCIEGYYCSGGTYELNRNYSQGILKCPNYSRAYSSNTLTKTYSVAGATSVTNCYFVCKSNTYFDGEKCTSCPEKSYSVEHKVYFSESNGNYIVNKENSKYICILKKPPKDSNPDPIADPGPGTDDSDGDPDSEDNPYEINGIALNVSEKTIKVGNTFQLVAEVTPRNAKYKKFIWTSSDPSIVTVDYKGLIYGKKVGSASIICTSNGKVAVARITVTDDGDTFIANDEVSSISLVPSSATIRVGSKLNLSYSVLPTTTPKDSIIFISSNSLVAQVDSNGVVTGISKGTSKIIAIAKDGSASSASIITVKEDPILLPPSNGGNGGSNSGEIVNPGTNNSNIPTMGLVISPTEAKIDVNEIMTLILETLPLNATNKAVVWKSSNPSIVEVTSSGVVTGKSYGTATITATTQDGKYSVSSLITVEKRSSNDIQDPLGNPGSPFADTLVLKLLIAVIFAVLFIVIIVIYNKRKKNKNS